MEKLRDNLAERVEKMVAACLQHRGVKFHIGLIGNPRFVFILQHLADAPFHLEYLSGCDTLYDKGDGGQFYDDTRLDRLVQVGIRDLVAEFDIIRDGVRVQRVDHRAAPGVLVITPCWASPLSTFRTR